MDYFRLAACLIRRELIDLSRHHFGHPTSVRSAETDLSSTRESAKIGGGQPVGNDDSFNPQKLSQWTEFHEYVETLSDEDRSLFDLLWYQGLTMGETSELLSVPLRTLGRRWKMVRVRLYRDLLSDPDDEAPSRSGEDVRLAIHWRPHLIFQNFLAEVPLRFSICWAAMVSPAIKTGRPVNT